MLFFVFFWQVPSEDLGYTSQRKGCSIKLLHYDDNKNEVTVQVVIFDRHKIKKPAEWRAKKIKNICIKHLLFLLQYTYIFDFFLLTLFLSNLNFLLPPYHEYYDIPSLSHFWTNLMDCNRVR